MNSITIIQSEKQTQLAISLHRNAEMGRIRLCRAKSSAERPEKLDDSIVLSLDVKARSVESPPGYLVIEVNFRLAGTSKSDRDKKANALCVECAFEVEYQLQAGFRPTSEQIKAFKDGNAIFNCWPFCRQHAQDMLTRMGYPPPTLPFLRVQTARRTQRKKA